MARSNNDAVNETDTRSFFAARFAIIVIWRSGNCNGGDSGAFRGRVFFVLPRQGQKTSKCQIVTATPTNAIFGQSAGESKNSDLAMQKIEFEEHNSFLPSSEFHPNVSILKTAAVPLSSAPQTFLLSQLNTSFLFSRLGVAGALS